jgi:hypothetical protein
MYRVFYAILLTTEFGERNVKIWIDFRKSPRFSLTSPLSQEREKSSRPVFTMCGEPCRHDINEILLKVALNTITQAWPS